MEVEFTGEIVEWRGPAPFHFLVLPPDAVQDIAEVARAVTYGWGMIPVRAVLGSVTFTTSLWPRAGGYVLPVKDAVRRPQGLELGDVVTVRMTVREGRVRP
ncbi:DUF1905 domain-containing protein [Nakamurella flavida]|uniref:DUF1905 domain-containing protein n=1 Tax=Nakamurella flavida TaxID=363630 RepID=A0A938YL80_9ACTN|nr:DUF1905 domain-containing protein [Nakamurella flavida]MBM9476591.1 DUF1905 domain-containing protein [Nakamurella flavida]MDP9778971.1 hypothetical protein [Nakamurella flavida]